MRVRVKVRVRVREIELYIYIYIYIYIHRCDPHMRRQTHFYVFFSLSQTYTLSHTLRRQGRNKAKKKRQMLR